MIDRAGTASSGLAKNSGHCPQGGYFSDHQSSSFRSFFFTFRKVVYCPSLILVEGYDWGQNFKQVEEIGKDPVNFCGEKPKRKATFPGDIGKTRFKQKPSEELKDAGASGVFSVGAPPTRARCQECISGDGRAWFIFFVFFFFGARRRRRQGQGDFHRSEDGSHDKLSRHYRALVA